MSFRLRLRNDLLRHLTPKAILAVVIPPQLQHITAVINQLPPIVDGGCQTVAGFEMAGCVGIALGALHLEREIDHRPQANCGRQRMAFFQEFCQGRQQDVAIAIQRLRRSQHQPGGPVRLRPMQQKPERLFQVVVFSHQIKSLLLGRHVLKGRQSFEVVAQVAA